MKTLLKLVGGFFAVTALLAVFLTKPSEPVSEAEQAAKAQASREKCDKLAKDFIDAYAGKTGHMEVSRLASDNADVFSSCGSSSEAASHLRSAIRIMKKPYEGESISPKDADRAKGYIGMAAQALVKARDQGKKP